MGLTKAFFGATNSTLADQWKEYFYCDSMSGDVLVRKGAKKVSGRSSNTKGNENVISNGSAIAVNDGQCMIIVEQGKVVEVCAEPGVFVYDTSSEPSIFTGGLGQGILNTFKTIGKRFTYGGDAAKDQRVYYFNTKEIIGNKYGTPNPVPFRTVDARIGLDIDISIRCHGEYSYKITDPILFYTNVCGNVQDEYTRDTIDSQLKSELMTALQPAFAKISAMGIRYSSLPGHTQQIADALNDVLSAKWGQLRGIEVASFGVSSVKASEEDEAMIKELQRTAVFTNANMAAASLVGAQGDAMRAAAANKNGAVMGFMGMNMASQAGGMNAQDLYNIGAQQQAMKEHAMAQTAPADTGNVWTCSCGARNTGKFCTECALPRPAVHSSNEWICTCGTKNTGKFCTECASPRPAQNRTYTCSNCGWQAVNPDKAPKFCPECGDRFDASEIR